MAEQGSFPPNQLLSEAFGNGEEVDRFDVKLSAQLVQLLSDQLYTSATKAIEELVVNSYDADARVGTQSAPERDDGGESDG